MTIQKFEDLVVWQLSRELVKEIYQILKDNKDYDFKSQIQRATISVMNNIAEGFDRGKAAKDNKQFLNFLNIAYGSCGEVKSMLYVAEDLEYVKAEIAQATRDKTLSLAVKISSLMQHLQQNQRPKRDETNNKTTSKTNQRKA